MSKRKFVFDDLSYYVWALRQKWPSNENGYDVSWMVKGYEDTDQADAETIIEELDYEMILNANHQQLWWLNVDGAIEAIGMLESDGLVKGHNGQVTESLYTKAMEARKDSVYTARIKPNVERVKNSYRNVPAMWSAIPEDPEATEDAISAFNAYNRKIVHANKWPETKEAIIHDGVAFGSGVIQVHHDYTKQLPDDTWFEERALQGQPLEYDEFRRFHKLIKCHVLEYVPTWEIIRHRNARGELSRSLSNPVHPMITRVRQRRLATVKREYPDRADEIHAATHPVIMKLNPHVMAYNNNEDEITEITHQIRMPVRYTLDMMVHVGNNNYEMVRKDRRRYAIVEVTVLQDVGIVDMCVDKYHHNNFTFEQWMHTPSSKHGCGIGLAKYGRDMERTFNIMVNGSLKYFSRMAKGGGFYLQGVLDEKMINKRTEEGAYVGIDANSLPQNLRNRSISELIQENRPPNLPTVYGQIMSVAEDSVNRAMMVPDAARGIRQGESGRHELALKDQAEQVINTGVQGWVNFHQPVGERVHSNIVQFDGKEEIDVASVNEITGERERVVLNKPLDVVPQYDPIREDYFMFPIAIKNNLLGLKFTTQLSTQSIVPANPAQRLFFYQEHASRMFPFIEMGPKGYAFMEWMNTHAYGDIPGTKELLAKLREIDAAQMEQQQEMAIAEAEQNAERESWQRQKEATELSQNEMRLKQHYAVKLMDALQKAGMLKEDADINNLT